MPTVRIDSILADFVKKVIKSGNARLDEKTIYRVIENSILYFINKHPKCLSCDFHRDMIIGLEVGRQKLALDKFGEQPLADTGHWVVIQKDILRMSKNFAKHYRRSAKATLEQAILEGLTRPASCKTCPFFSEMQSKVKVFREEFHGNPTAAETSVCSSPSSHGAQPPGCSGLCEKADSIREGVGVQNPDSNGPRDGK